MKNQVTKVSKDDVLKRVPRRKAQTEGRLRQARTATATRLRRGRTTFATLRGRLQQFIRDVSRGRGRSRWRKRAGMAAGATAVGGAGAYFLDPNSGKRRRHVAKDKAAGLIRTARQKLERQARYRAGQAGGAVKGAAAAMEPSEPPPNDEALAERVRSQVFRPADAPKGSVNVNVEDGVVYLRGEVEQPERVDELIKATQAVEGVRDVESLLHTPGQEAPKKNGSRRQARSASKS